MELMAFAILGVPVICVALIIGLTVRALFQYAADEVVTAWRNAWERFQ